MSAALPGDAHTDQLPEAVRARIVALTAQVLPQVSPLPAALRRVAEFAPARRAKLGATQIALAIGRDEEFREHVATQAAVLVPELATAVSQGDVPATADPTEVAALAWLLRPEGWPELVDRALEQLEAAHPAVSEHEAGALERLRSKLADAEQGARDQRARLKDQLDAVKAENSSLRRKLGDARVAERAAAEALERERAESASALSAGQATAAAAEAELRRLRSRVSELEASAGAARRESRAEREDASLRARLLLDALLESAQGLRRELALPTVAGAPADRLEAELASVDAEARSVTTGVPGPSSPALLENYLSMPKARLIVDGYNVSKTAWPESSLEAQRLRLLSGLAALVARSGAETTVVFDAATSATRPPVNPPRGVKVIFSPVGVIADDVIRDLVDAEPHGRVVVVVTSDLEIVRDVTRAGARSVSSDALIAVLSR